MHVAPRAAAPLPDRESVSRGRRRLPSRGLFAVLPGRALAAALGAGVLSLGCGGKVVFERDGSGGAGGATGTGGAGVTVTTTSAVTTTSVTTTSSGAGGAGGSPPIPALVEKDYGILDMNTPVVFDAPPGILGFTAIVTPAFPGDMLEVVGISDMRAPSGAPVITSYTIDGTLASYYGYGIAAAGVPQTDHPEAMPVKSGPWTITLGNDGFGAPQAHLSVWYRQTVDGAFHGGKLDVNVFIAGGVVSQGVAAGAIETAFGQFAGLELGTVTFHTLGVQWTDIDESNFYQVLEQTATAPGKPALNVIAVASLSGQLAGAAGVTPNAPAVALQHGTNLSGIVVTLFDDPIIDSLILRHETGHFAGLFHTSEFDPGLGDALGDTPFCADVTQSMESCPDYANLMFPTGGDMTMLLSQEQLRVIEGSALYRGVVEEGGAPASPLGIALGDGNASGAIAGGWQPHLGPQHAGGASQAGQAWRANVPARAARFLESLWCPGDASARSPSPYATLRAMGGDAAGLLAVAAEPGAPAYVRRRALAAAGHAAPTAGDVARLVSIAEDGAAPEALRLGAIEGVAAASRPAARSLAGRLAGDVDRVVANVAGRAAR